MTTHVARLALEWWRAGLDKSEDRLRHLVIHFARTNGEIESCEFHQKSARAAVYSWEL